jgi:CheY-like chemotaxis protein
MSDGGKVKILLVEDISADIYLFRKALESAGLDFELTTIENGAKALALVAGNEKNGGSPIPDLIVLDLNMPKNDALRVLRTIRQDPRFKKIPVVMTSSSPSLALLSTLEELNIARYIHKPPDLNNFLKIGEALKGVIQATKRAGAP